MIAASALAIAISTIVFSSNPPNNSVPDTETGRKPRIDEINGEVTATLPFFHRIDENYLRGSQPLHGGIGMLERLGVKTLVDLRSSYDDTDDLRLAAEAAGLDYEWVPTSVWNPPTDEEA